MLIIDRMVMILKTKKEINILSGPLLINIIRFSLPLCLTGMLQLLYNAADIIVVGKFASEHSLAAVSSTGSLINLIVNVFMGLSVGASVVVSQNLGAGKYKDVNEAVHTAIMLSAISGIAVGIFGFFASKGMLQLMDSPAEVIDLSALYVKIYFVGMPANMIYNFGAAILRAVGETKKPLYYLTFSGIVNVILNLVFVIIFKMDVAGVALATIISQIISAFLVIRYLIITDGPTKLSLKEMKIHGDKLKKIAIVGLPAGIQGSLFSISNVIIQSSINAFGPAVMAGNGAASSIEGFVYTAMNSIYQASITFAGQNYGAGNIKRIKKICLVCLAAVSVTGLGLGILAYTFGGPLLSIYTDSAVEIGYGLVRMSVFAFTYFLLGTADVMVGMLRGIGHSLAPTIVSIVSICGFRLLWIFTVYAQYKASGAGENECLIMLFVSYPISWLLATLCHIVTFIWHYARICKHKEHA